MPHRLGARYGSITIGAVVALVVAFIIITSNIQANQKRLEQQHRTDHALCQQIRELDTIMVVQLVAAKQRALASLPDNRIRREQLIVLNDGIRRLSSHSCDT